MAKAFKVVNFTEDGGFVSVWAGKPAAVDYSIGDITEAREGCGPLFLFGDVDLAWDYLYSNEITGRRSLAVLEVEILEEAPVPYIILDVDHEEHFTLEAQREFWSKHLWEERTLAVEEHNRMMYLGWRGTICARKVKVLCEVER